MATNYNILMKRFNGTDWDILRPLTLSDNIDTTSQTNQFVTSAQKTAITTYLTSGFNGANQLLQLDANGLIPTGDLPFSISDYLLKNNPTFTGVLTASSGGSNNINVQNNSVLYGYGTASGSLAKWKQTADGTTFRLQHDIGSGFVNSVLVTPTQFSVANKRVTELLSPTANTDAATKEYVDNLVSVGFTPKDPVMAASIANVTLGAALNSLDGYTLAAGNRVLLKDQTTANQNGVYLLDASKIPQKVAADSGKGSAVFVEHGTTNNDYIYVCTGTDTWSAFSKVDTILAGSGLSKSGNTISIASEGVTNAMLANGIAPTKLAMWAGLDSDPWTMIGAASTENGIVQKIDDLFSAVKNLRGTANYNTNNTQTISGAYTAIAAKNSTTLTNANPVNTNRVTGDMHFQYS